MEIMKQKGTITKLLVKLSFVKTFELLQVKI